MTTQKPTLDLNEYTFAELFTASGLAKLDRAFLAFLQGEDSLLYEKLIAYREPSFALVGIEVSEFLIALSLILQRFLANLFHIEEALAVSQIQTTLHNPIAAFKKYFVLRRARKDLSRLASLPSWEDVNHWLNATLEQRPLQTKDHELAVALLGVCYLSDMDKYTGEIEMLTAWCVHALVTPQAKAVVRDWVSFKIPSRLEYTNLVPTIESETDKRLAAPPETLRLRDGFKLTDPRMSSREVQDQVNYCIYCHDHDGDFCSKGFPVKKGDPAQGFKKNPLEVTLTGCPLEEKISEMHLLKKEGETLAALAMIMVDNPMCPATGHRICNECMKACIYQKQDPVNIPQIETRVLIDVLNLPWGVEIYDLLTRWNPLRQHQWVMKPYNGLKVMIAGMGPAGFTLAHHLLLEGYAVVGFDGLKIEPLPRQLIDHPVHRFTDLKESLDERIMAGFGGVAEYGITVRWDKNFLKLIYLSLLRRPYFQVYGGVRFGGTITVDDAWEMGFDHLAVAVGAGLPKAIPIPGSLAPGMRQANDFLMALQLGNAAKMSSLTNLQIRMPVVVIGGGLTGVDAATEAQAYYIRQVEKIRMRYETLQKIHGEDTLHEALDPASKEILSEFLRHAHDVDHERKRAKLANELPNFIKLIHEWGGVTIAYRRKMQESPAYIHNHEELQKALQEGIFYLEGLEPIEAELNKYGQCESLLCHKRVQNTNKEWVVTTEEIRLPARSILVATGTQPNTAYEFEHRGTFNRLNLQYQHYEERDGELTVAPGILHCKEDQFGPFTSYQKNDRRVSLIGDTHPVFHGSVVKAIASGMRTYPKIVALLKDKAALNVDEKDYKSFAERMDALFHAKVMSIKRKSNRVIELIIKAPLAAKHFKPGQFYRLQNFETFAPHIDRTHLQMEPLALVVAAHDKTAGTLTFSVTETSATAKLCALLKPHEWVSLMGPTGVRAKIPAEHETVLIVGQANSLPFVRSYGTALRKAGNRVLFCGEFEESSEVYCQAELEEATDSIIWHTKAGLPIKPRRVHDYAIHNEEDTLSHLIHYAELNPTISLGDVDRIYIIGNTDLLRRFQAARQTTLKPYLLKDPNVFGAVYGNMQCMLKGVCAQCLQWQIDPVTQERTKAVFVCSWQDQPLEIIDIHHIDERAQQNRLHEKMNSLWVDYLFNQHSIARV